MATSDDTNSDTDVSSKTNHEESIAAASAWQSVAVEEDPIHPPPHDSSERRRIAISTLFFSFATALSRVAGLVREIIAAAAFGVTGAASAFQTAFLVPNIVRALFADAALQAAFVPVFTELLEQGRRREAFRVASTLLYIILLALGCITVFFIVCAPWIMPLFAPGLNVANTSLLVGMSQILFPIVVMLGITGLMVGMLNAFDHFSVPAIAPLFWNLAIIACVLALPQYLPDDKEIYAYALGVVVGTFIQMLMPIPVLRRKTRGEGLGKVFDWRSPHVKRVLILMAPVSIGLGLINFDLAVNSIVGSLVSEEAVAAINYAFRVFMLPQGVFSVAIATVLFPVLARLATRGDESGMRHAVAGGVRQMYAVLIPSAVALMIFCEPIARLLFGRGAVDEAGVEMISTALFWFAFSLPLSGSNLMYTRAFFALQMPWLPTKLAVISLVINGALSFLLHFPFGIAGVVGATAVSTAFMTISQAHFLRRSLSGIELRTTVLSASKMLVACAPMAAVSLFVWSVSEESLGASVAGQAVALSLSLAAGFMLYGALLMLLRVEEARQLWNIARSRIGRS